MNSMTALPFSYRVPKIESPRLLDCPSSIAAAIDASFNRFGFIPPIRKEDGMYSCDCFYRHGRFVSGPQENLVQVLFDFHVWAMGFDLACPTLKQSEGGSYVGA